MLRIPPIDSTVIVPKRQSETVLPTQAISAKVDKDTVHDDRRKRQNRRKNQKGKAVIDRRLSADRRKPGFDEEV
jgi:hypothetical protein